VVETDAVLIEAVVGNGAQAEQGGAKLVDHAAEQESELGAGGLVGVRRNFVHDR